jgi:negative regulator of replication initiation
LYKTTQNTLKTGKTLQPKTVQLVDIYNKTVGVTYKQYSVIQGVMAAWNIPCTLILGQGGFEGLLG